MTISPGVGRAAVRAGLVALVVLAIDQITKVLARDAVPLGGRDEVTSFLDIVHVRNDGVAFSAFGGKPWIVVLLISLALVALLYYFATHADQPLVWLATGLLFGGAVGNILDRVRDGAVTDFIKFSHWPAFNVADVAINLGVVVLIIALLREDRANGDRQSA
jgi:signal peptidase II